MGAVDNLLQKYELEYPTEYQMRYSDVAVVNLLKQLLKIAALEMERADDLELELKILAIEKNAFGSVGVHDE